MYKIVDDFDIEKLEENGFTKENDLWKVNIVSTEHPHFFMDLVVDDERVLKIDYILKNREEVDFYKKQIRDEVVKELTEKGIIEEVKSNAEFPSFIPKKVESAERTETDNG